MKIIRRLFIVGSILYFIAWVTIPIPHAAALSASLGALAILTVLVSGVAWIIARLRAGKRPTEPTANHMIFSTVVSVILSFMFVALATSGDVLSPYRHGNNYNWEHWLTNFLTSLTLFGLYVILVQIPYFLHKYVSWELASERTRNLLPSWSAAGASVLTGAVVLLMHMADGPLASVSVGRVVVAGFAVAVLLVPFFKWCTKTSWELGIVNTLRPSRWRAVIGEVRGDIRRIKVPHAFLREHVTECSKCRDHFEMLRQHIGECEECSEHAAGCEICKAGLAATAAGECASVSEAKESVVT